MAGRIRLGVAQPANREVLSLKRSHFDTCHMLAVVGLCLHRSGRFSGCTYATVSLARASYGTLNRSN